MGQVPQKVLQALHDEPEPAVDITTEDDDADQQRNWHAASKTGPGYINPSKNPHGRIIINPDPLRIKFYDKGEDARFLTVNVERFGRIRIFKGKDVVSFMHPVFRGHEVMCDSVDKAQQWLSYYITEFNATAQSGRKADVEKQKPSGSGLLSVKPLSDLVDASSEQSRSPSISPAPLPPLPENTPSERVINGRRFVCHPV